MSIGSLSRSLNRALRAETERSLVVTAIAIERYTLRHGSCQNRSTPSCRSSCPLGVRAQFDKNGQPVAEQKLTTCYLCHDAIKYRD